MAVLPPPGPGCTSCAARDAVIAEQARVPEEQAAVIAEQARVLEEQAGAIGGRRPGVGPRGGELRAGRRGLARNGAISSIAPAAEARPGRNPPAQKPMRGK